MTSSLRLATLVTTAGLALATAADATAAPIDGVIMDPSVGSNLVSYGSASSPGLTTLPVVFTPNTRDAFSKTAPLVLPCDVNWLSVGVAWKNVSSQPLYIEWAGSVFLDGNEKTRLPNAFGQTTSYIADGRIWQPGEVGDGGFIFIAYPPLIDYDAASFPANAPFRLQMESRGFTSNALDIVRGGYSLLNLFKEDVIWNNNYRIWAVRSCP